MIRLSSPKSGIHVNANGEMNKIDGVQVDGVNLTPDKNKKVNITNIPKSAMSADVQNTLTDADTAILIAMYGKTAGNITPTNTGLSFNWNSERNGYEVSKEVNGLSGDIVIPYEYDDGTHGLHLVTDIAQHAFNGCAITSVIIPKSIRNIGPVAFFQCRSLTSITIPNSVISIGDSAFYGCNSLAGITIPNSVISIGDSAFKNCTNIPFIILPNNITTIYNNSFSYNHKVYCVKGSVTDTTLQSIANPSFTIGYFEDTSNKVTSISGSSTDAQYPTAKCVYDNIEAVPNKLQAKKVLTAGNIFTYGDFNYTVNSDAETVMLTSIAAESLSGSVKVPEVVYDGIFAYQVTKLGDAFKNQGNKTYHMTSLILPDTITNFTGTATFYGCHDLRDIKLPKILKGDGNGDGYLTKTFYFCPNLYHVEIPSGITKFLGTFASDSTSVDVVVLTSPAAATFYADSSDTEAHAFKDGKINIRIFYPDGGYEPTRIEGSFVATAYPYSSIVSKNIIESFLNRGRKTGNTFTYGDFTYKINDDTSTVTLTSIATSLSGIVVVPSVVYDGILAYTVTKLGDAFKNQGAKTSGITSITLPDTITKFTGTAQFYGCSGLTSIHLPSALTGDNTGTGYLTSTFMYCSSLASVEIPSGITKFYGTFRNSAVRTVTLTSTSQADFYAGLGTTAARAWTDGTTGINIYYPYVGTAPTRITGSFTATAKQYNTISIIE